MSTFLSALLGKPINLIPMTELVNKVRMLLGSSGSDDKDKDKDDDTPAWKKRGDCCANMRIVAGKKETWDGGTYVYHYCKNCGKSGGTAW